jgi:Flp pilus assembly protein TadB
VLTQSEAADRARVEALRTAIQGGFDSGIAHGDVIGRLRSVIRERARADHK